MKEKSLHILINKHENNLQDVIYCLETVLKLLRIRVRNWLHSIIINLSDSS